ncbi:MAG: SMC-Scp complex subunit ScpB [Candidatus Pacearchaeota archaeon]|nr:SMC-Scp complex subunit ScpB [Candidatus Pacearchaeota archaeon]
MEIRKESVEEIDKEIEAESKRKVEAALFIAGKWMSLQELVALTDVNPILLKKILEDLIDEYRDSGIEVINQNNLWKMDVSKPYVWIVNKLASGNAEFSKAEQETLAIIAYKQPIKQSVVVKIRGNKAYEHIRKFVEMGLITKKKIGHTAELTLSENFYDYFHVDVGNKNLEIVENKEIINSENKTEKKEGTKVD